MMQQRKKKQVKKSANKQSTKMEIISCCKEEKYKGKTSEKKIKKYNISHNKKHQQTPCKCSELTYSS